jgi:uncharacterized protein
MSFNCKISWIGLDREQIAVDFLINNPGLGDSVPFAISDPVRNREMILVNVAALTSLTRHLLPEMIAQHRGDILNVRSSAGLLPIPSSAVYAATKSYVMSFSEALLSELRGTGWQRSWPEEQSQHLVLPNHAHEFMGRAVHQN